jgi:hypothetical protein
MKLIELLLGIQKKDIVLPEFQREYVWSLEQSKQLIVSLFNSYPVGAFLFWNTDNPPEIKNIAVNKEKIGTITVILDGQQRLTTLYLLMKNEIPPYYIKRDIKYDPRHLYFNLRSGKFLYYKLKEMKNNPLWVKVIDCFSGNRKINPIVIADEVSKKESGDAFTIAKVLFENLTKLKNILEMQFPVQYIPGTAGIDESIDIFDRVNSLGTKLSDGDLALTHITGKWSEARRVLKQKIKELEEKKFYFDLGFMVRCIVGIVKNRGLFETIHKTSKDEIIDGWKKLSKILDYLMMIFPKYAFIHSAEEVNTTNIFVPVVVYLSRNNNIFPNEAALKSAIRWLYFANLWARYTGQTDQRLDHDINIIARNHNPWPDLVNAIIDQRGRIKLEPGDLEGRSIQNPIYRMLYVIIKAKGAVDWFNGLPLDIVHGKTYSIQSHHIFPSSILWKTGKYKSNNSLHKITVNDIANRAFLTASTNNSIINNKIPEEYFIKIIKNYGEEALNNQLIPLDRNLWKLDNYEQFLNRRRALIANEINKFIDSFVSGREEEKKIKLNDYLKVGESSSVEYKSSIRWDMDQNKINKELEKVIIKTIDGFLNFEGGILLIGVDDNGGVIGIDKDISTLKKKNIDGFQQLLINLISEYLGAEYSQYINIAFEKVVDKFVCIINIDKAPQSVFVRGKDTKSFYIRSGNTTKLLNSEEAHNYIQLHWQ